MVLGAGSPPGVVRGGESPPGGFEGAGAHPGQAWRPLFCHWCYNENSRKKICSEAERDLACLGTGIE